MTFRAWTLIGSLVVLLASAAAPLTAERQPSPDTASFTKQLHFRGLAPGKFVVHKQRVPVDIVLIGFDDNQVSDEDVLGRLPEIYKPVVRYPQFYGLNGRDLGLEYALKYSITRTKRQCASPGAPS